MRKMKKLIVAMIAGSLLTVALAAPVAAAPILTPTVPTTLQTVEFAYDPGKIVLPYGAMLAPDGNGNWILAFLDTSFAVVNSRTRSVPLANGFTVGMQNGEIVYWKNIEGRPIRVSYNLSNCVARVDTGDSIVLFKNGSILSQKITNNGMTVSIESYNDSGAILQNQIFDAATNQLIYNDDYVSSPGLIMRTYYANGVALGQLPFYGDTKPAF